MGSTIFTGSIENSESLTIDLAGLNPGLYILTVTDTNTTYYAKVIKK